MSNAEEPNDDLINFNATTTPSIVSCQVTDLDFDNVSDNLLDTELPDFEQKLQTSSQVSATHSRSSSVDIEDILISIDDDYDLPPRPGPSKEPYHFFEEILLQDLGPYGGPQEEELENENVEAFRVLDSLDEILNAHLQEEDEEECEHSCDCFDSVTQQSIEECLSELDDYLKGLDSSLESDEDYEEDVVDRNCDSANSFKVRIISLLNFFLVVFLEKIMYNLNIYQKCLYGVMWKIVGLCYNSFLFQTTFLVEAFETLKLT